MNLRDYGVAAVRVLLLATPLAPLLVAPGFVFPFVTMRAVLFRMLVLTATLIVLALATRAPVRTRLRGDPILLALTAFLLVQIVSALTSAAPWSSIYGGLERMGGVISFAHLILYYVLLRSFFTSTQWRWYFRISVGAAVVLAVHAVFEYYTRGVITSLIGNSGLLGIYLLFHLGFIAAAVARCSGRERRIFLLATLPISAALILSQNRSSLLGLIIGASAALLLLSWYGSVRLRRWRYVILAVPLLFLSIPLAARIVPQLRLQEASGTIGKWARVGNFETSESSRLNAWHSGLKAFANRPVLGYGPDNYHLVWSEHTTRGGVQVSQYMQFDRAHNAYIDTLALTGTLGMLAYLAVWLAVLFALRRAYRSGDMRLQEAAAWFALFVGHAVYLFFWFDDVNSSVLHAALLAFIGCSASREPLIELPAEDGTKLRVPLAAGAMLALAASMYLHGYETLRLSRMLVRVEADASDIESVLHNYRRIFTSPAPQSGIAIQGYLLFLNRLSSDMEPLRQDPYRAAVMDSAIQRGFKFIEVLERRDPRDPYNYVIDANLSIVALRFYRTREYYDRAHANLRRALALSPGRLSARFLLAETYRFSNDFEKALAQIDTARYWGGNTTDADYFESRVQQDRGSFRRAAAVLARALRGGHAPAGTGFVVDLVETLERERLPVSAAYIARGTLENHLGSFESWTAGAPHPDTLQGDLRTLAARMPILALAAGDVATAVLSARALQARLPSARPHVSRFMSDVRSGNTAHWLQPPRSLLPPAQ